MKNWGSCRKRQQNGRQNCKMVIEVPRFIRVASLECNLRMERCSHCDVPQLALAAGEEPISPVRNEQHCAVPTPRRRDWADLLKAQRQGLPGQHMQDKASTCRQQHPMP
eukprot:scaffold204954_cov27-Tisochrysis_lutea.AAC.3